jgi:DNA-binding PadR family transcriptional regulator
MKTNGGTTPNALLGLLTLKPMSGYDMRAMISESVGHFWSESYGQIYPSLKRLAAEGFVEKKTQRQKGKPDRHVYSLTAEGRERLQQWLKLPVEQEAARSELLLKLFFGAHVSPSVSREHVVAFIAEHEKALKSYAAIAKGLRREESDDPQLPFWLMTLNMGRHRSAASVKWGRETLKELEKLEKTAKRR